MPKVFKVEKAFLSTGDDKKTPQVVNTKGGEMHKYMVQFENQSIPGWIGILKKPGNSVSVGEEMYGVLEENQWGKPQFTRMQLPQDGSITLARGEGTAPAAKSTSAPAESTGGLEAKVDYLIGLMENFLDEQGLGELKTRARGGGNSPANDDGDTPIDLSQIPY